ncbi:MAG: hypothetical protein NT129_04080 [Candidatus Aenigmarchaeota archaeon]|nr:hypothetical protein [Candidatus Aenigmarchaeota archaeon]
MAAGEKSKRLTYCGECPSWCEYAEEYIKSTKEVDIRGAEISCPMGYRNGHSKKLGYYSHIICGDNAPKIKTKGYI